MSDLSYYPQGMSRRDLIAVGELSDPMDDAIERAAEDFEAEEIYHIDAEEAERWLCSHGCSEEVSGYCLLSPREIEDFADSVNQALTEAA